MEGGVVRYVEYVGGDVIEAELGCGVDDRDCVVSDVLGRLGFELKLPSSVIGAIKARLKYMPFPIAIELRSEGNYSIVEFRGGSGDSFQLIIRYQVT